MIKNVRNKDDRKYKKTITILITPKLSKENKLSSGPNNVSFENDKNNPDLLILNERIKTSKNMNFKNNVNFSNYKKSIINNFVSSDNFNLSNNRITDDIKKRIIELSRELSKKVNL